MLALRIRPATAGDSDFHFRLRNDPETIRQSTQPGRVLGPTHDAWYTARLASSGTALFVAVVGTTLVGTGRLTRQADGRAELSYVVAPEQRGKGHGTALVAALRDEAARRGWGPCVAEVKPGNAASIQALRRAGFVPVGTVRFEWAP